MGVIRSLPFILIIYTLLLPACEPLKVSKPILPIAEYERLLAGRLDADYVGTDQCLSACHFHDQIRRDFDASTMGAQLSEETGLPLVNCESCHGPGSLAIAGLTPGKVARDARAGKQTTCNYNTFIPIKELPAQAKSLICLKCHTGNATFNLHDWNVGEHAAADVSCLDCHNIHAGPDLKVQTEEIAGMCFSCHPEIQAEFFLPSHHPVPEQRVVCTDCHQQHGSPYGKSLRRETVKETCTKCHGEKEGPFLYEHAENTEDCTTCHRPHGSVNNNLLALQMPFLCLQCHPTHQTQQTETDGSVRDLKGAIFTRCTDCHSRIHGTDTPSVGGTSKGRLTH